MPDYLLMVLEDEGAHAAESPAEMARLIEQRAQFADALRREGRLRDAGRFRPSREGVRLREQRVTRGPFVEGGRSLAAYYWVDAPSADDATELARRCPLLASDLIDVRPLMKGRADRDREAKRGKAFAFAVLGNALTEAEWTALMDRIDADTPQFPVEAFLGGLRLRAPSAERRALADGPFLESKEVIGGLFLLRMPSLEDAIRWAQTTRYVVHGTLEVRELWRC